MSCFIITVQQPEAIALVPSRSGPLYEGTSFEFSCFVRINRVAVDVDVQAILHIIPGNLQSRTRLGRILQVNDTTFSRALIYDVLTVNDRQFPTCVVSITSDSGSVYVINSVHNITRVQGNRLTIKRMSIPPHPGK